MVSEGENEGEEEAENDSEVENEPQAEAEQDGEGWRLLGGNPEAPVKGQTFPAL